MTTKQKKLEELEKRIEELEYFVKGFKAHQLMKYRHSFSGNKSPIPFWEKDEVKG